MKRKRVVLLVVVYSHAAIGQSPPVTGSVILLSGELREVASWLSLDANLCFPSKQSSAQTLLIKWSKPGGSCSSPLFSAGATEAGEVSAGLIHQRAARWAIRLRGIFGDGILAFHPQQAAYANVTGLLNKEGSIEQNATEQHTSA